jgi:hypothetical protein
LEAVPAVLYDAVVIPSGREAIEALGKLGHAAEFIKDQYRHCKPLLVLGAGRELVENTGVPLTLPSGEPDPGVLIFTDEQADEALAQFVKAIGKHRHFAVKWILRPFDGLVGTNGSMIGRQLSMQQCRATVARTGAGKK